MSLTIPSPGTRSGKRNCCGHCASRVGARASRQCEAGNAYIFELDDEYDIDGSAGWNPARFLNHSCAPNCDAELIDGQIWIVSRRDIDSGEELTFNYGYDREEYREHPCHCGAP